MTRKELRSISTEAFDWPRVWCVRRRELCLLPCRSETPSSLPPPPSASPPSGPAAGYWVVRQSASTNCFNVSLLCICSQLRESYTVARWRSSSFSSDSFWLLSSMLSITCFSFFTSSWSLWLLIWRSATQLTSSDISLKPTENVQPSFTRGQTQDVTFTTSLTVQLWIRLLLMPPSFLRSYLAAWTSWLGGKKKRNKSSRCCQY